MSYSAPSSSPSLNDAGQTAFTATLTGSGLDSTNNRDIWSEGSGSLTLVARGGSLAPGTPSGVTFSFFISNRPLLNNAGQIAFQARITGGDVDSTNAYGIWSQGSGSLALVARTGTQAPGTPSDVNYLYLADSPALNNAGQTAFIAPLTGSGVDSTNDWGIWSEGTGTLALVAREGD